MTDTLDAQYVRLTTFTRDRRRKHTPVWLVQMGDDTAATTTDDDSWKIRRIRKTPKVELAASDGKGAVRDGVAVRCGCARIIPNTSAKYRSVESAFVAKYGWQYRLFRFVRRLRGKTPCAVVISLDQ